ncbi:gliding motility-associated C-terminal domain-containing protein [bacterium SCSIO 12741]|nr:gliding motility-associated C-terminal domain-containing protein [bacterium SCSIO 12741]
MNWRSCFVLLTLFGCSNLFAQKEANWWFFGQNAGIDFSTISSPVSVTGSAMSTVEGCASISDKKSGQLLFYTDGVQVWDRRHQRMPNGIGLKGHSSAAQSALIVPDPAGSSRYYIFTVPEKSNKKACYSIVDMTLNQGMGDVIASNKNTPISNFKVADKLTAIRHINGRDFWVLLQDNDDWTIYAYLVNGNGVSQNPTVNLLNNRPANVKVGHMGCLKASPDGKLIASTSLTHSHLMIFDFNGAIGAINERGQYTYPKNSTGAVYGAEFSQDSRILYVSSKNWIDQYELYTPSGNPSVIRIDQNKDGNYRQMQLAPDGKIYVARSINPPRKSVLGVIHQPTNLGAACGFNPNGFQLRHQTRSEMGLPAFLPHYFDSSLFEIGLACAGAYTTISLKDTASIDSIVYDYGDLMSMGKNQSKNKADSHNYKLPGQYKITAKIYYTYKEDPITDLVVGYLTVHSAPDVDLGNDTILCTSAVLGVTVRNTADYDLKWSNGSQSQSIPVMAQGQYWVEATNQCGIDKDTIQITKLLRKTVSLGPDSFLCVGDTLIFDVSDTAASYYWQDGSRNAQFAVTKPGVYTARVKNLCGMSYDNIRITSENEPVFDLGRDTTLCQGQSLLLNASASRSSYRWQDGTTDSTFMPSKTGWVIAEASNICGNTLDSVFITFDTTVNVNLGADTILCKGSSITLYPPLITGATISWSDNSQNSHLTINKPGTYWIQATKSCGTVRDTIEVIGLESPVVNLPPDFTACEDQDIFLTINTHPCDMLWNTGIRSNEIKVTKPGKYWAKAENVCGSSSDTVVVSIDRDLKINLGVDTTICDGEPLDLYLTFPNNPDYEWNSGIKNPGIRITETGIYSVTVTNQCGSFTDHISVESTYTPVLLKQPDIHLCQGDEIRLKAELINQYPEGTSVVWMDNLYQDKIDVNSEGDYHVKASNNCGVSRDTIHVYSVPLPRVPLPVDTLLCNDYMDFDFSSFDYEMKWQDDSEEKQYTLHKAGNYYVELTGDYGCFNRQHMRVVDCGSPFFVPSAFTPNGDGDNDIFYIVKNGIRTFSITIVDRWNNIVYQSVDIEEGWDGTNIRNGEKCTSGQYIWKVTYRDDNQNALKNETGSVNLLRYHD